MVTLNLKKLDIIHFIFHNKEKIMSLSYSGKIIASIALASTFFSGCSATRPEVVNNKEIGTNNLYATLNNNYTIKDFNNKEVGRGFIVNNYKPFGFDTSFKMTDSNGGCLWLKYGKISSKYENIEVTMNTPQAVVNLILLPLALPLGLKCANHHIFDYNSFNSDMKDLLPNDTAKKLVSNYDNLIENEHVTENKINKEIKKLNNKSLKALKPIKEKYLSTEIDKIKKKTKIVDKTGLYNKEKLPVQLNVYKNNLPAVQLLQSIDYSEIVNSAFPCDTVSGCISNMNNSVVSMQEKYSNDAKQTLDKHKKLLQKDLKQYIDHSKFYNVENNLKSSTIQVKKNGVIKNIFYTVAIKSDRLPINQNLKSILTVRDINYSDVFPKYSNSDKNIKIIFNFDTQKFNPVTQKFVPEIKTYKIKNNTDKFIQIKSVSLYYDGSIYKLTLSKDSNAIATELSPQAINTIGLYDNIKESNYINVTKKQAQKKNFKFGFAIKYTIGEQTKNITLYSQHIYNLYSLIKDI